MVRVASSRGGVVQVEIKGINRVVNHLRMKNIAVTTQAEIGLVQAGNFVQQEVQESIIGNRAEPKSVDTGRLGNSIVAEPTGKGLEGMKIFPERSNYPGTSQNTQDVAKALEFGTSRIRARKHFFNTKSRTKDKVVRILKGKIKV
ncbi:MAG: hypothetical protein IIA87_03680 [Nanoarchaeota archaeon]|nr:hypothetical protein [Nanoarchaeota archaeon]